MAEDDSAELIQASIEAGLRGDKPALQALLDMLQADGISERQNWSVDSVIVRTPVEPWASSLTGIHRFEPASIPMAVGLALSRDGPPKNDISTVDLSLMKWRTTSRKIRSSWNEDDEQLVQSAIELWRPGGRACEDTSDTQSIRKLLVTVARYALHEGAIAAFSRAGIDAGLLASTGHDVDRHDPSGTQVWPTTDPARQVVPLPALLLETNNFAGADWLLGHLSKSVPAEAERIAQHIVKDITDVQKSGGSRSLLAISRMARFRTERTLPSDWTTDEGVHILSFLNRCMELQPSRLTQVAQLKVLSTLLDSGQDNQCCASWDPEFVRSLLDLPSHRHRPALRHAIGDWRNLVETEEGALPAKTSPESQRPALHALAKLMDSAVKTHCHPVLAAGRSFLDSAFAVPQCEWLAPEHCVVLAGAMAGSAEFQPEDFRKTLEVLSAAGAPVTKGFKVEGKATSLLHALADTSHRDQAPALVVALEAGCDPYVRNQRRWRAASCVKDPGRKEQWFSIEKSVAARRSALDALEDLGVDSQALVARKSPP